ncbi:vanadium-dependent haloperoxidase [Streptomyces sp. ID05-26A]|nr:vanadium-dependent haloperoxidase [Streptomyces sp. ID05-26A]
MTSGSPFTAGLSRRRLLAMTAGAASLAVLPAEALAQNGSRTDLVGPWFGEMIATMMSSPGAGLPERTWAMSWGAALDALGGGRAGWQRAVFEDAAVASAVHGVLTALIPDQKARLDAVLAGSLATLPAGPARDAGTAAGRASAAARVAARVGDGLDIESVNAPFTLPPEAPGIYRLTPGATRVVGAGYGRARPFLLGRGNRFRLGAPPVLGTAEYRRDLDELHRLGGQVSERTEEQDVLAWLDPMSQYTPVLRLLAADQARPRRDRVRLLAALGAVIVDTSIAVFDSKYTHLRWRPVTAIRAADTDGDPRTKPDPAWTPNLLTPPHPEYPSGHAATAGAAEQVLTQLVGPSTPMAFSITFPRGDGTILTRDYRRGTTWAALTRENVDARVLAGVHFRFSDEAAAALGRRVARYDLGRL